MTKGELIKFLEKYSDDMPVYYQIDISEWKSVESVTDEWDLNADGDHWIILK
jgi:hypothetical protein